MWRFLRQFLAATLCVLLPAPACPASAIPTIPRPSSAHPTDICAAPQLHTHALVFLHVTGVERVGLKNSRLGLGPFSPNHIRAHVQLSEELRRVCEEPRGKIAVRPGVVYDGEGNRLTNLAVGTAASYAYTLDAAGHRLSVAELSGRTVNYTYDALYRLTSEAVSGTGTVSYIYDPVGNRKQTTSTIAQIPAGLFNYDANDRLSTDTYDANGNTTSSGGTGNVYDFENHLIARGSNITMVYDGDGNRVAKTAGGITTRYLVDDLNPTGFAQVIVELIANSAGEQRHYVYGLERLSQRRVFMLSGAPAETRFYGYDGHGSVRLLTDPSGTVTDTYDYDAFGNLLSSTGLTPNHYRFAGEQLDFDLGLYYNRARYLNANTGRFWTTDTFEGRKEKPLSAHKYVYASNSPVDRKDPSGHDGDIVSTLGAAGISTVIQTISTIQLFGLSIAANLLLFQAVTGYPKEIIEPEGGPQSFAQSDQDRECRGFTYEVGTYINLLGLHSGCPAHHVPQDALARRIYNNVTTTPGWPGRDEGPAIILPAEEHLQMNVLQAVRFWQWVFKINNREFTRQQLIHELIDEDFLMLGVTSAPGERVDTLRRLVNKTYYER